MTLDILDLLNELPLVLELPVSKKDNKDVTDHISVVVHILADGSEIALRPLMFLSFPGSGTGRVFA